MPVTFPGGVHLVDSAAALNLGCTCVSSLAVLLLMRQKAVVSDSSQHQLAALGAALVFGSGITGVALYVRSSIGLVVSGAIQCAVVVFTCIVPPLYSRLAYYYRGNDDDDDETVADQEPYRDDEFYFNRQRRESTPLVHSQR